MSHHHRSSSSRKHTKSNKYDTTTNNNFSSTYHYHRESKKNPHLSDIDRNWEKMERYRERKMTLMKIHKINVESRMKGGIGRKKNGFLHQPVHQSPFKHEGRKISLDPNWYTENIYSNQSIDNSDEEKKRKRILSDLNGNRDESDDLFIIDLKPRNDRRYPKSSSCCFATIDTQPPIPKSHSFCTARGSKYNFFEFAEYASNNAKTCNNKPSLNNGKNCNYYGCTAAGGDGVNSSTVDARFSRICDREGCVNETCFAKDLKPVRNNDGTSNLSQRNKNTIIDTNDLFNDADIFSFDDDDSSAAAYGGGNCSCGGGGAGGEQPQQRTTTNDVYDNGLDKLYKTERSKILLRNKFDRLNKYTDDFTDDYNKSFDDLLRVTEYTSPNYVGASNKNDLCMDIKPSKYDDSDSESVNTDVELDDFTFDLEKYWNQLEKNDDVDINRNMLTAKDKSVSKLDLDLLNANDPYPDLAQKLHASSLSDNFPISSSPYHHYRHHGLHARDRNAFSLLNNIFSIYKPNKYSPLNCHQQLEETKNNRLKSLKVMKVNALSSTRPLGIPRSPSVPPYISSGSRPLVIYDTPPPLSMLPDLSPTLMDRPRFQIIPHKTGVKVTPLYRLEYDHGLTGKHKYKLKSNVRPLTFW